MNKYLESKLKTTAYIFEALLGNNGLDTKLMDRVRRGIEGGMTPDEIIDDLERGWEADLEEVIGGIAAGKTAELSALGLSVRKSGVATYLYDKYTENIRAGIPHSKIPPPKVILEDYKTGLGEILKGQGRRLKLSEEVNAKLESLFMRRTAGTVFNTELQRLNRQAEADIVAAEAGVNQYMYWGIIIETTRPFCIDLLNSPGPYTRDEIDRMVGPTSYMPVFEYCGGWNCQHQWIAVNDDLAEEAREAPRM